MRECRLLFPPDRFLMARVADQRKRALSARRCLDPAFRRQASKRACRRLTRLPALRRARRIGIYQPLASEIDPRPLCHLLSHTGPQFYYPRTECGILRFVPARADTRWRRSALGVDEPEGWGHPVNALDVLIMPLAGFDDSANRIGLGGGFYDRTLASIRHSSYRSPARIGFAFECQHVGPIEPQPWDVELAAVVTEAGVYP